MQKTTVTLVRRADRAGWYMQYRDPETGRKVRRATGTDNKREAERMAGKWEEEIREGKDKRYGRIPWDEFRQRYEDEVLPGLAQNTADKVATVFNTIETRIAPRRLCDLTSERLGKYQQAMREAGRSENTIKGHLAHLRSSLAWAVDVQLLPAIPKMPKCPRAKSTRIMKGRPITGEEFDRMLSKVEAGLLAANEPGRPSTSKTHRSDGAKEERQKRRAEAVAHAIASWEFLLRGLWWSGLRLQESLELHWTDESKPRVDMTYRHPMLRIVAEQEKGHKDRLLPIAPEFAQFLEAIPAEKRIGCIFNPKPIRANKAGERLGQQQVGRMIGQIGKAAGVKVSDGEKVKFATAHDLRRSFGTRWAARVMPQVLMELMRHESIETTLRYYVGRNAQATATILWDAARSELGAQSGPQASHPQEATNPATA